MILSVEIGDVDQYKKTLPLILKGEVWRTVHTSILGKAPVFPPGTEQELEERLKLLELKGAKLFLLRRLAMKNYHSAELSEALKKRLVSTTVREKLIAEMRSLGYIDDAAWLASYIRALRAQKFGFRVILNKLKLKGIPEDQLQEALQAAKESEGEEGDERASIAKLLQTRYRSRDLADKKQKDRIIAALQRKGYGLSDIFAVLNSKKYTEQNSEMGF